MWWLGIVFGLATAVLQALSYVCSAAFLHKYGSSLRLLVFSQLAMGAICLVVLPFVFPRQLLGMLPELAVALATWAVLLSIGQLGFFGTQKFIEASRLSSLLGLKIIVLSVLYVAIVRVPLNAFQWTGVALSTAAAFGMNWSGNTRFPGKSLLLLAVTLVAYSLTDMTETHLVNMPKSSDVIRDGVAMAVLCYALLGVLTVPFLWKIRWTWSEQRASVPFAAAWLLSQVTLLVCFGILGTVFGNVIQASRGAISVLFGALVCKFGWRELDAPASPRVWIRRALAALLWGRGSSVTVSAVDFSVRGSMLGARGAAVGRRRRAGIAFERF